jgi:8-oxo-dGTP diphosphatase
MHTTDHHDTSLIIPAIGITVLVFNDQGELLLSRRRRDHGNNQYCGPGGGLNHGETPPNAAHRETHEEANITITALQVTCLTNFLINGRHYLDIAFTATTTDNPQDTEPDTHEPWQWYNLDNLPTPLFHPTEQAIKSYNTGQMYNW